MTRVDVTAWGKLSGRSSLTITPDVHRAKTCRGTQCVRSWEFSFKFNRIRLGARTAHTYSLDAFIVPIVLIDWPTHESTAIPWLSSTSQTAITASTA